MKYLCHVLRDLTLNQGQKIDVIRRQGQGRGLKGTTVCVLSRSGNRQSWCRFWAKSRQCSVLN